MQKAKPEAEKQSWETRFVELKKLIVESEAVRKQELADLQTKESGI